MSVDLVAERLNRGLSIRGAAEQIEVGVNVLRAAEAGGSVHPGNAKRIADFYGHKVTDIWPVETPKQEAA